MNLYLSICLVPFNATGRAERMGFVQPGEKVEGRPYPSQYLKGGSKEEGISLFTRIHMERTGEMGTSYSWGDSDWTAEENLSKNFQKRNNLSLE